LHVSRFASVLLITLLTSVAWAEDTKKPDVLKELVTEAEIPRGGDFMGFGFDALWIMSGPRLAKLAHLDGRPSADELMKIIMLHRRA